MNWIERMERRKFQIKRKPFAFSHPTIVTVLQKSKGHCWYCGKEINIESRKYGNGGRDTYVIDHVVPLCLGGNDEIENLVPCCWFCNSVKGRKSFDEFREHETRKDFGVPKFSLEQIEYLKSINVDLPELIPHIFYFERECLP
jgi:5-methylcytosine-specific restriction endonuclease McrA